MPHLDATALESDPEGMAFLRDVIGSRQPTKSWPVPTSKPLPELRAQAKSLAKPLQDSRRLGRRRRAPCFEVVD